MPTEVADKAREARLRAKAQRQGLALAKSRRRDQRSIDFGMYMIVDPQTNGVVTGTYGNGHHNMRLDEIVELLYQ